MKNFVELNSSIILFNLEIINCLFLAFVIGSSSFPFILTIKRIVVHCPTRHNQKRETSNEKTKMSIFFLLVHILRHPLFCFFEISRLTQPFYMRSMYLQKKKKNIAIFNLNWRHRNGVYYISFLSSCYTVFWNGQGQWTKMVRSLYQCSVYAHCVYIHCP